MSKKLETIKDAVFFSRETPEKLANLICGLITDVITSVVIDGASSITIPTDDSVEETYTATAVSQFGDIMNNEVTLSLKEAVTGVSVSDMKVTVTSSATASSFVLKAVCGEITKEITVALISAEE